MRFKFENIIGQKKGKLEIVEYIGIATKGHLWKFRCDCGNHGAITSSAFNSEKQKGCYVCGSDKKYNEMLLDPLYKVWLSIKQRCYNPKDLAYRNYGARGVSVCEEWMNSFKVFRDWCLENGWKQGLHIDKDKKIDNNLIYGPDTCSVIERLENNRLRRGVKLSMEKSNEIKTSKATVKELAAKYNVSISAIYSIKQNKSWNL